jgi:hypothetical protein
MGRGGKAPRMRGQLHDPLPLSTDEGAPAPIR